MVASKMVAKLWCLPRESEEKLTLLFTDPVDAVVDLKIGVESERDMVVLFPADMMTYGLGTEIVVELSNIPVGAVIERKKDRLVRMVAQVVQEHFLDAHVQYSLLKEDTAAFSFR